MSRLQKNATIEAVAMRHSLLSVPYQLHLALWDLLVLEFQMFKVQVPPTFSS